MLENMTTEEKVIAGLTAVGIAALVFHKPTRNAVGLSDGRRSKLDAIDVDIIRRFVKKHTHNNDHTQARIDIAAGLNNTTLERAYKQLDRKHLKAGHLTKELSDKRNALDKKLFSELKKATTEEDYKKIYREL
jgi:ribosomal protein L31E